MTVHHQQRHSQMKYHIVTSQELIWTTLLRRHIVVHLQKQPTNKQVHDASNEQLPARLCSVWLWNWEEQHIYILLQLACCMFGINRPKSIVIAPT